MDNLAHTLVGAALGRAVADRKVPAAGWIGAIAGNAPDWSELLVSPGAWGGAPGSAPAYLVYHRGITHSFVGAVIEIVRSEEHTSELQSRLHLVCRLLLEKKKKKIRLV